MRYEARKRRLKASGFDSYEEYLQSNRWRRKRSDYWKENPGKKCHCCGDDKGLQLHHATYKRVCKERLSDLIPVCQPCHAQIHELERTNEKLDLLSAAKKLKSMNRDGGVFIDRKKNGKKANIRQMKLEGSKPWNIQAKESGKCATCMRGEIASGSDNCFSCDLKKMRMNEQ